jgi:hypothetical protein
MLRFKDKYQCYKLWIKFKDTYESLELWIWSNAKFWGHVSCLKFKVNS